jgi:hypothetical protein
MLMNSKDQMLADAFWAIGTIAEDLGLVPSRATVARMLYLYERHGSSPVHFTDLPRSVMGRCWTDEESGPIEIDPRQCGCHLGAALAHELAHRLCYCSARYEELNSPRMMTYDRHQFQEIVARGVEWIFYTLQAIGGHYASA